MKVCIQVIYEDDSKKMLYNDVQIWSLFSKYWSYHYFYFEKVKPSSNWSLFKHIISDQTLIKLKLFLPIYVHFNGQTFSSDFEQFSFTSKFFG